jgi:hypothetical protein
MQHLIKRSHFASTSITSRAVYPPPGRAVFLVVKMGRMALSLLLALPVVQGGSGPRGANSETFGEIWESGSGSVGEDAGASLAGGGGLAETLSVNVIEWLGGGDTAGGGGGSVQGMDAPVHPQQKVPEQQAPTVIIDEDREEPPAVQDDGVLLFAFSFSTSSLPVPSVHRASRSFIPG